MHGLGISEYIKLLVALFTLIVIFEFLPSKVFAFSPSFVRQEVKDAADDWWDHYQQNFTSGYNNFADISAVSYFSDGRFLNATLFLRSPFIEQPYGYAPAYGVLINADSNQKTGWEGHDYFMRIAWDNDTNTWTYTLEEWSTSQIARVLEQKTNYTDFFDSGENSYIHLSLDLNKLSSPQQYIVVFFVDYVSPNGRPFAISDYSNWVRIPPPEFFMTAVPNELTLRPGQEKSIEVQVNSSTTVFEPHIILSANQIHGLDSYFIANEIDIPPRGIATSDLYVKALDNARPDRNTLQIFANISFPTQFINKESQLKTISENSTVNLILPVTVIESLTFGEQFSAFWNVYGDPISLVGGGFAAGFAALVFNKLQKTKGK
jgi:hypothetical protein